ncbi:MAG TPA: methyltransferase [Cytophagales bacterium]|nr:methyltransferase [Cytophagales bacterium]HAP58722.1 methyltransferase [Cytophagales bacterium]
MEFLDREIQAYSEDHTQAESPLLRRVHRETHVQVLRPRMLSGPMQGRLLSMLSHMQRPQRILEIGTYTGYSALCLAEGLADGGKLITLEVNNELESRVRGYIAEAGMEDRIELQIGDALELIPAIDGPFDLVFLDADKVNYGAYYDLVIEKMPAGGVILADNVLWTGKVVEPVDEKDKDTQALLAFNKKVQEDSRVENILLPFRDGIMMARKL